MQRLGIAKTPCLIGFIAAHGKCVDLEEESLVFKETMTDNFSNANLPGKKQTKKNITSHFDFTFFITIIVICLFFIFSLSHF